MLVNTAGGVLNFVSIHQLTNQWTDILVSSPGQTAVLNVATWLSRTTMDSVGEGVRNDALFLDGNQ
jgi:hypothetical protein